MSVHRPFFILLLGSLACTGGGEEGPEDRGYQYLLTILPVTSDEMLITIHHSLDEIQDPGALIYTLNGARLERDLEADPTGLTYQTRIARWSPGDTVTISGSYPSWGTFEIETRAVGELSNIRSEPPLDAWVRQLQDGERPSLVVKWDEDPLINQVSTVAGGVVGISKLANVAHEVEYSRSDENYDAATMQPSTLQDGHFQIELEPRRVDQTRWGHGVVLVSQTGETATLRTP